MRTIKIGLCDDNASDRRMVIQWITKYYPNIRDNDIIEFENGNKLLHYLKHKKIDVLFLDCQMDDLDGIETAKRIRDKDRDMLIILISNYIEFAADGYGVELNIFRYVLKSNLQTKGLEALKEALIQVKKKDKATYTVKFGADNTRIYISDVMYVASSHHIVEFNMVYKKIYSEYKKLDSIEKAFEGYGFIRCHKSFLVNCCYIRKIYRYDIELNNNYVISVSRERYKETYDSFLLFERGEK